MNKLLLVGLMVGVATVGFGCLGSDSGHHGVHGGGAGPGGLGPGPGPGPGPGLGTAVVVENLVDVDWTKFIANGFGPDWKLVETPSHWIYDFGPNKPAAIKAAEILKHYKVTQEGIVGGGPGVPGNRVMYYYLVNGHAPTGAYPGEDAIAFNWHNLTVNHLPGVWTVNDGSSSLVGFTNQSDADKAVAIIQKHKFTHLCFVGRGGPVAPMTYFRK